MHCVKGVRIRIYYSPPASGLNTERYSLSLRIQSKCGEMRTRITPNTDTFYVVMILFFNILVYFGILLLTVCFD